MSSYQAINSSHSLSSTQSLKKSGSHARKSNMSSRTKLGYPYMLIQFAGLYLYIISSFEEWSPCFFLYFTNYTKFVSASITLASFIGYTDYKLSVFNLCINLSLATIANAIYAYYSILYVPTFYNIVYHNIPFLFPLFDYMYFYSVYNIGNYKLNKKKMFKNYKNNFIIIIILGLGFYVLYYSVYSVLEAMDYFEKYCGAPYLTMFPSTPFTESFSILWIISPILYIFFVAIV